MRWRMRLLQTPPSVRSAAKLSGARTVAGAWLCRDTLVVLRGLADVVVGRRAHGDVADRDAPGLVDDVDDGVRDVLGRVRQVADILRVGALAPPRVRTHHPRQVRV